MNEQEKNQVQEAIALVEKYHQLVRNRDMAYKAFTQWTWTSPVSSHEVAFQFRVADDNLSTFMAENGGGLILMLDALITIIQNQ